MVGPVTAFSQHVWNNDICSCIVFYFLPSVVTIRCFLNILIDRPRLQIICPTNAVAKCQTNSNAIIGLWSDPDCTGGVQPITTSCNPSSGSDISSGQTFAICTCVDNAGETETCFFNLPAG